MIASWADVLPYVLTAVLGGGVLKWADTWLNRTKARNEQAKHLRDEARAELTGLKEEVRYYKEELRRVQEDSDKYKKEAWENMMQLREFQLEVSKMLIDNGIKPEEVLGEPPA